MGGFAAAAAEFDRIAQGIGPPIAGRGQDPRQQSGGAGFVQPRVAVVAISNLPLRR